MPLLLLRRTVFALALGSLACLCLPQRAAATLLVLPNGGWTAGIPLPGQTKSQTFSSAGAPNYTISINNNGSSSNGISWAGGYPAIDNTTTNGGTSQTGMQLYASSSANTSSYILCTVSFVTPVQNLSLQIWDVDKSAGQFIDTITGIQAINTLGNTIAPSSVASTVSGYNTVSGSGLNYVVNGIAGASNTTNQGSVDIVFTGLITQFSFRWSNTDPGVGQQAIGFGNINFTAVPEMSALWPALGLFSAVFSTAALRRRKTPRA